MFDENVQLQPNFKEDDIVVCINNDDLKDILKVGQKYKVINIFEDDGDYMCHLDDHSSRNYFCARFIPELEYNIKQYNI